MTERSLRRALVPLGAYLLAFGLLSLGGARRTAPVVLVAAALLVVAAVLTQRLLREARRTGRPGPRTRLLVPLAIMAAGAGLVAYWALGGSTGGWGLAGVCALYLGAGQALAEVRARRDAPRWRGPAVSAACAALFAAGLLLCLGVSAPWLLVAAVALLLAPVGLTLTSEDVLRRPPRALRLGLAAGPLAALAGGLLLPVAGVPAAFTWPAVAALFVLVGAIASNTQADVLLIVTVIGLIWAATPRPAEPAGTIEPERGASALAALGDSYMSGEGARRFFEGTNDAGVNECRRSPTAYAHLVVLAGAAEHLAFYACSGAVASHLHRRGKWEPTQLAQLRSLLDRSGADLDLVLVSIGGNDAGFATIGMACLAPGSCVERGQAWLTRLEEVGRRLRSAYAEIRRVVRDDVPVVAVPYPDPIRETPCGYSLLGEDEHRFLHRFVEQLSRPPATPASTTWAGWRARSPAGRGSATRPRARSGSTSSRSSRSTARSTRSCSRATGSTTACTRTRTGIARWRGCSSSGCAPIRIPTFVSCSRSRNKG